MISHLDRALQVEFSRKAQHLTQRRLDTTWVVLARYLYFAKKFNNIDGNVAISASAKTSRKAQIFKTKDGGCEGFIRQLKEKGWKLCHDRGYIKAIEDTLEDLGIIEFEREGHGCVAIAHINLRAAALFLELFHPDFEWLEETFGTMFHWIKPFCDEILGRKFNRNDPDGDAYDGRYLERDVDEFHRKFPRQRFNFAQLPQHLAQMFQQFCRKRREISNFVESVCVFWDVDISNPPEWEVA